jgi:hypothetical protein
MQMNALVLMADVVASSRQDAPQLQASFQELVSEANLAHDKEILSPLTVTLGDEFQGVCASVEGAMRIMFTMEERLVKSAGGFKLRYILVEGEILTEINTGIAYGMMGPALTAAREELLALKSRKERWSIRLANEDISYALARQLLLYQWLVDSWGPKDFAEVSAFLDGMTYREVAGHLQKAESSSWRREKSLGIHEYQACKELLFWISKRLKGDYDFQ